MTGQLYFGLCLGFSLGWPFFVLLTKWLNSHVHDWGKYEEPLPKIVTRYDMDEVDTYTVIEQKRTCKTCGLVEWTRR